MTVRLARLPIVVLIVASMCAGPALANSFTAALNAAIEGVYGGKARFDGLTNVAYVVSEHPTDEEKFTFSFLVDPSLWGCTPGDRVQVATVRQLSPTKAIIRVLLECGSAGVFKLRVRSLKDNGKYVSRLIAISPKDKITIQWCANSGGPKTGLLRLFLNGVERRRILNQNYSHNVDQVRFGITKQTPPGMFGRIKIDEYESFGV